MKSTVVLAGGRSTRYGINKALVQLRGRPLVMWVVMALSEVVDEVILSISSEHDPTKFKEVVGRKVVIVKDVQSDLGPVSGLIPSFSEAKGEYVAVAPCDSPFIKPELYSLLFERAQEHDGAVPFINNFWEPLHAVYKRKTYVQSLKNAQSQGKFRPVDAYANLNIQKVTEEEVRSIDKELFSFFNINSIEDHKKAEKIAESLIY
ncbi:MAG: molybdenum cofactor guanylyltransferase [Thermoplasmata archaeon]|nr:MAG: molybdenum cofactor guanylyltransferase [Thermoplasmata archaeon]